MKRYLLTLAIGCFGCLLCAAQSLPKITEKDTQSFTAKRAELYKWQPWQFLIGTWKGDAKGDAGEGPGEFTFKTDLDGKILEATNNQEFPAKDGRPAFTFHSLMIIYLSGTDTQAIFYDNEGHVLNYTVQFSDNPKKVTFTGETVPYTPAYRFSYTDNGDGTLKVDFDTAPANAPKAFTSHVAGVVKRAK